MNDVVGRRGAARLLGVSVSRVQALMDQGRLVGRLVDGRWLFDLAAVNQVNLKPRGRPKAVPAAPAPVITTRPVIAPPAGVLRPSIPLSQILTRRATDDDDVRYEPDDSAPPTSDNW